MNSNKRAELDIFVKRLPPQLTSSFMLAGVDDCINHKECVSKRLLLSECAHFIALHKVTLGKS